MYNVNMDEKVMKTDEAVIPEDQVVVTSPTKDEKPISNGMGLVGILVLIVAVLVIGILGYVYFYSSNNGTEPTPSLTPTLAEETPTPTLIITPSPSFSVKNEDEIIFDLEVPVYPNGTVVGMYEGVNKENRKVVRSEVELPRNSIETMGEMVDTYIGLLEAAGWSVSDKVVNDCFDNFDCRDWAIITALKDDNYISFQGKYKNSYRVDLVTSLGEVSLDDVLATFDSELWPVDFEPVLLVAHKDTQNATKYILESDASVPETPNHSQSLKRYWGTLTCAFGSSLGAYSYNCSKAEDVGFSDALPPKMNVTVLDNDYFPAPLTTVEYWEN